MTRSSTAQAITANPPSLIDITSADFKANPFPFYAALRQKQPVCRVRIGQMEGWLLSRYDDVHAALKDPRLVKDVRHVENAAELSKRPWLPGFLRAMENNMLDQDDPNHARLRGLVHRAFTPARIDTLQQQIDALANRLLDRMAGQARIELIRDFALPLPLSVICELLGVPEDDRLRFSRLAQALLLRPTALNILRMMPSLWALIRYLRQLIARKKAQPQDDLLSALHQVEEAGERLSEDEQVAMALLLLIAGHETTVNLIASGTLALLQHPDQLAWLRQHPEGMKTSVEELLRYCSPVDTATERYAAEDIKLHGTRIRRGELVIGALSSANRDPDKFSDPDALNLQRDPNRHLSFGYGSHYCLGASLARMEAQIAFKLLLARFPNLRLAVPASTLRWRATPVVRGLQSLPLQPGS